MARVQLELIWGKQAAVKAEKPDVGSHFAAKANLK